MNVAFRFASTLIAQASPAAAGRTASSFAAALELVREGEVELHQQEAFAPLYFRKRQPQTSDAMAAPELPVE